MSQNHSAASLLDDEEESNDWLTTLADVMMLLIVFFVYCFTLADSQEKLVDGARSEEVSPVGDDGYAVAARPRPEAGTSAAQASLDEFIRANWGEAVADISAIQSELDRALAGSKGVSLARVAANKLMIRLEGNVFFDTGSTWVKDEMFDVLDAILPIIQRHEDLGINIQGHTDNVPIKSERLKNNWELSVLRATETLEYFTHYKIPAARLTASGHADSQPIASNATPAGRAKNRRIDIMLERVGQTLVAKPEKPAGVKALRGKSYLSLD